MFVWHQLAQRVIFSSHVQFLRFRKNEDKCWNCSGYSMKKKKEEEEHKEIEHACQKRVGMIIQKTR